MSKKLTSPKTWSWNEIFSSPLDPPDAEEVEKLFKEVQEEAFEYAVQECAKENCLGCFIELELYDTDSGLRHITTNGKWFNCESKSFIDKVRID